MAIYLYAISSSEQPAPVKIGKTGNLAKRLSQLQTASPVPLQVWWSRETTDEDLEAKLHRHFSSARLSGEWFQFNDADWLDQLARAAELLEVPGTPLSRGRNAKRSESRAEPHPRPHVTHGHRPPEDVLEHSWDTAGTGLRCLCGHPMTLHCGDWPYSCGSANTGWTVHDPCECPMFRSSTPWSLDTWLASAADCGRCQAALEKDPKAELWSAQNEWRHSSSWFWA